MNTQTGLTTIAHKHYHPRKPILYWQAFKGTTILAENNSIALLRHQFKGLSGIIFKGVR